MLESVFILLYGVVCLIIVAYKRGMRGLVSLLNVMGAFKRHDWNQLS